MDNYRELDDDIGSINMSDNSLNIDCVSIDIRKDYYDTQGKSKFQIANDNSSDYFAVVVSWSLEVNLSLVFF